MAEIQTKNQFRVTGGKPTDPRDLFDNGAIDENKHKITQAWVGMLFWSAADGKRYEVTAVDEKFKITEYREYLTLADEIGRTVAPLEGGKISATYIPGTMDAVEMYDDFDSLPSFSDDTPEEEKPKKNILYLTKDDDKVYRYCESGSDKKYVEVSESIGIGTTPGTAYEGSRGAALETTVAGLSTKMGIMRTAIDAKMDKSTDTSKYLVWYNNGWYDMSNLIADDLDNDNSGMLLSAAQGKALSGRVGKLSDLDDSISNESIVEAINDIVRKAIKPDTMKIVIKVTVQTSDEEIRQNVMGTSQSNKGARVTVYKHNTEIEEEMLSGRFVNGIFEIDNLTEVKSYTIGFGQVDGVIPPSKIDVQAVNKYNVYNVVYGKPTVYNTEKVCVTLFNYSSDNIFVAGQKVQLHYTDEQGNVTSDAGSYADTNENGFVSFNVQNGKRYQIEVPTTFEGTESEDVYECTGSYKINSIANTEQKDFTFAYRKKGTGVICVYDDGTEIHYTQWLKLDDSEKQGVKFIRIKNDNVNFLVVVENIRLLHKNPTYNPIFNTYQLIDTATKEVLELDKFIDTFDGYEATSVLISLTTGDDVKFNSVLVNNIIDGKFKQTKNGAELTAYIATIGEFNILRDNAKIINIIMEKSQYDTTITRWHFEDLLWENSDRTANCAWTITKVRSSFNFLATTGWQSTTNSRPLNQSQSHLFFPFYKDGGSQ